MFASAKESIKPVADCPLQAFYTNNFQLFDIIDVILSQVQHCRKLTLSSFSISEEFIRKVYRSRNKYKIERIDLFLDLKATNKIVKLHPFMKNVFDNIYLVQNHGKVILFESNPLVSICTSQNQTRGNRNESHLISTGTEVYETFLISLEEIKNTAVKL